MRHDTTYDLGAACDIVGLCVAADDGVMQVVTGGLLDGLRPGSSVVNHGTATPGDVARLTEVFADTCAPGPASDSD